MPPVSEAGDGWLRLVGEANVDVHEPHQIKITVTLNGVSLGSTSVGENGEFRISFPFAGVVLEANAAPRVLLEVTPTFVPAETIPESTDQRELGVKIHSISVVVPVVQRE